MRWAPWWLLCAAVVQCSRGSEKQSVASHAEVQAAIKVQGSRRLDCGAGGRPRAARPLHRRRVRSGPYLEQGIRLCQRREGIPTTPATLYRIASITKTFTATAILQLRDDGKLQLDDPVARHLPWFKYRNKHSEGPAVTIRHLLTHTSGLPREATGVSWSDLTFPPREAMMRGLAEQESVFPSQTEWKYSNLAVSLAGEVVAAVSGEPWDRYIENHILAPLGMKSTRTLPEASTPRLATG